MTKNKLTTALETFARLDTGNSHFAGSSIYLSWEGLEESEHYGFHGDFVARDSTLTMTIVQPNFKENTEVGTAAEIFPDLFIHDAAEYGQEAVNRTDNSFFDWANGLGLDWVTSAQGADAGYQLDGYRRQN